MTPDDLPEDSGPPIPPQKSLAPYVIAEADGEPIVCSPKIFPHEEDGWINAATRAVEINPGNAPPMMYSLVGLAPDPGRIAVMTGKYWGPGGVNLTVGFMDNPDAATRAKILLYMNEWSKHANIKFSASSIDPQVRIARERDGYWSYLGTDILGIPKNRPTMNLQGFTANTPDRDYARVVTHETAHTCGCPHEHARRELVARIDPEKAIAYFRQTQGWNANTTRQQVLTPLEEASIMGSPVAEEISIMTYQLPGSIMRDGRPLLGGERISAMDAQFMAKLYPKEITNPPDPPVPPTPAGPDLDLTMDFNAKSLQLRLPPGWTVSRKV